MGSSREGKDAMTDRKKSSAEKAIERGEQKACRRLVAALDAWIPLASARIALSPAEAVKESIERAVILRTADHVVDSVSEGADDE